MGFEDMRDCQHQPRCGSASVHHARRRLVVADLRRAAAESTSRPWKQHAAEPTARPWTPHPPEPESRPWTQDPAEPASRSGTQDAAEARRARLRDRALYLADGLAPWEMTADEFAAAAEPWVDLQPSRMLPGGPSHRVFGISVSMLRTAIRLRMIVRGGPESGYEVDVPWDDDLSREDPRRAFVAEALGQGLRVPPHVLADYPDLQLAVCPGDEEFHAPLG